MRITDNYPKTLQYMENKDMKLRVTFEERKCENQRVDNDKRY